MQSNGRITVSPETAAKVHEQAKAQYRNMVAGYSFDGHRLVSLPAVSLDSTIMEKLADPADLLRVRLQYPEDGPDDRWRASCEALLGGGCEHHGRRFRVLGAGSGLKNGTVWMATDTLRTRLHRYFGSSQEALSYLGILFSGCHHGVHRLDLNGRVVKDGQFGTADGMGFVSRSLMERLGLPERQIQVRLVSDTEEQEWMAKGTLLPRDLPDGLDIVLPESMIKGAGHPVTNRWQFWFGVREIAQVRPYSSAFSFAMWFDQAVFDALAPVVDQRLSVLRNALNDREHALRFLGLLHGDDDLGDARTTAESFLSAGLTPDHPWLHRQLLDLRRRSYIRLALGGGFRLSGRMGAFADLPDGTICAPDLDAGRLVLTRYPLRDPKSLLSVINDPGAVPHATPGTVYLNETTAQQLDGDFDGDAYVLCDQPAVVKAVDSPDWYPWYDREDTPAKRRKRDSLALLPYVAVHSLGNRIGSITYAIAGAVLSGHPEKVASLSAGLQAEVQSLKWDTRADRALLDDPALQVPRFISEVKLDPASFGSRLVRGDSDHPLARHFNHVAAAWRDVDDHTRPLLEFKPVIPIWREPKALEYVEEALAAVQLYNRWIARILEQVDDPSRDDLQGPLDFLRAWDAVKVDDRKAWAVALWHAVHNTRTERSTGSAAFHAFTEEMLALIAEQANGPVQVSVPVNGRGEDDQGPEPMSGGDNLSPMSEFTMVPLVGAARELDGGLRALIDRIPDPEHVVTVTTVVGDDDTMRFYRDDLYLGQVPKDHLLFGSVPEGLHFDTRLLLRGRTVYLVPVDAGWLTMVAQPVG